MGTWKIEIDGHGIHHNRLPDDANVMLADFVRSLIARGHEVSRAEFTLTGSTDDVLGQVTANGEFAANPPTIGAAK